MRGGSLMRYARNKYSQNGEDGIIGEVIGRLDIESDGHPLTFVEFGVGNGRDLSNTLRLAELGWSGVWFEQDHSSYEKAKILGDSFNGRVETIYGSVGFGPDDNLDVFLGRTRLFGVDKFEKIDFGEPVGIKTKVPYIDFMSIDIDSYDAQVWDAMNLYAPMILLIEINSGVPVGVEQLHGNGKEGNSFTTVMKVAERKGYTLVCHTGNLLFVRSSFVAALGLPASEIEHPETIFNPMWAEWTK